MTGDLTKGNLTRGLLAFALPMMAGNLLQQLYNIVDTLIVGQVLGGDALAAVGSSYTLMTFLTSVLLGLCMGSGVAFSIHYGRGDGEALKKSAGLAFGLIGGVTLALSAAVFLWLDPILGLLQVPEEVYGEMREYLFVIFFGILATFLYNFFASLLRAVGNSVIPLLFLGGAALLNVGLDLLFVLSFGWGVAGAAGATVIAQWVSGLGILLYVRIRTPELWPRLRFRGERRLLREILQLSSLTCVQQSVMNFGILMVQGLVNSFGPAVMAAFAAGVKIDSFAYMPAQDFGNAFSTFVAQNYGAGERTRIAKGTTRAVQLTFGFCAFISALVFLFARELMLLFVKAEEMEILAIGVRYLRIEGSLYFLIGFLFLLYGFYRAVRRPGMSVVLTVLSLGTRVLLAYLLAPGVGVEGIWAAVPVGWLLADTVGYFYYRRRRERILAECLPEAK